MTHAGRDGSPAPNRTGRRDDEDEASWRLFVAVPVPEPIRAELDRRLAPLRSTVHARWQSPDTWHLTLQFLGQVPVGEVPPIESALMEAAHDARPFRAELRGTGAFDRRGAGAVAWIGMATGAPEVAGLAESLRGLLHLPRDHEGPFRAHLTLAREAPDGIATAIQEAIARPPIREGSRAPGSRRAMSGATVRHGMVGLGAGIAAVAGTVGLDRAGDAGPPAGATGAADMDASADPATLSWTADRIVLYRSILGRGPARHLPLATALLGR